MMGKAELGSCFYHVDREAVAVCPECQRLFCRECITEHDLRMICAGCLAEQSAGKKKAGREKKTGVRGVGRTIAVLFQLAAAFVVGVAVFHAIALFFLNLPSGLHDGEIFGGVLESIFSSSGGGEGD